jgi:hypothetical protein
VYYDRYKATVSGGVVSWAKEYRLNNSSFTAAQWAAISSGITATKVAQYDNANIPVGFIMPQYKKVSRTGWLYLDGRDTTGQADELETVYPDLYAYLGNSNVLPDYREFALVGAEQNTTDTIAAHDVYAQGEGKDDQIQEYFAGGNLPTYIPGEAGVANLGTGSYGFYVGNQRRELKATRQGTVTRGKRKAVYFYIKAL